MKTLGVVEVQELFTRIDSLEEKVKALEKRGVDDSRDEELQTAREKARGKDLVGGYEECGGLWGGFDED